MSLRLAWAYIGTPSQTVGGREEGKGRKGVMEEEETGIRKGKDGKESTVHRQVIKSFNNSVSGLSKMVLNFNSITQEVDRDRQMS